MSINHHHHVKTFEEFLVEDLKYTTRTTPFDHSDEDELDDADSPDLPDELKNPDEEGEP
jgi:hypothetical protein